MDANWQEFWQFAAQMIGTPRVSQQGTDQILKTINSWASRWGMPTQSLLAFQAGPVRQENILIGRQLHKDHYRLVLQTHIDTVPAGEGWRHDPYALTRVGDTVTGLGVADVTLDFCAKMYALKLAGMPEEVLLVGTAAEEIGMLGVRAFLDQRKLTADLVLVGEPSELIPMAGHKGYLPVRLILKHPTNQFRASDRDFSLTRSFTGRSAHGSRPYEGESAFLKAVHWLSSLSSDAGLMELNSGDLVNKVPDRASLKLGSGGISMKWWLRQIDLALQSLLTFCSQQGTDSRFLPPEATFNIGVVSVSPHETHLSVDLRLLPGETTEARRQALEDLFSGPWTITVLRSNEPLTQSSDEPIFRRFLNLVNQHWPQTTGFQFKTTSTEASLWRHRTGSPTLVFAPGRSERNSHCPNEANSVAQVQAAVRIYYEAIQGVL